MKQFMTNGISPSPTIAVAISDTAFTGEATELKDLGGKGVKFAADGGAVLCSTKGELAIGVVTIDNDVIVSKGDIISVQLKDRGLVKLGESVVAGDALTVDASGTFVKATDGNHVRALALTSGSAGSCINAMLVAYKA